MFERYSSVIGVVTSPRSNKVKDARREIISKTIEIRLAIISNIFEV